MHLRRTARALTLAVIAGAGLVACGRADVAIPDSEFAPTAWELAYEPADMTVWRAGRLSAATPVDGSPMGALRPAEGATLELLATRPDGRLPLTVVASTTIGADGRFRIGPGPATNWVLRARLPEHAVAHGGRAPRLPGVLPLPDGEIQLGVRPAWPFEVRIVGDDGAPVASAAVRAEGAAFLQDETTDTHGVARFVGPAGLVKIEVRSLDRELASEFINLPRPDGSPPFELLARVVPPVSGRVVDGETGAPISGAVVLIVDDPTMRTRSDSDGRFTLRTGPIGRVAAFARGKGWRSTWIRPGEDLELRLSPAHTVRGTVLAADGRPVAGARIIAAAALPDNVTERVLGPVSAADGSFTFDWLPETPPGAPTPTIVAQRRGLGWSAGVSVSGPAANPDDSEGIVLRLGGERVVSGAVVRQSGALQNGVPLQLALEPPGISRRDASIIGLPVNIHASVGLDGKYHLAGMPANFEGVVRFDVDGATFELPVVPGAEDAEVRLELDESLTISGRVEDVSGDPVAGDPEARSGYVLVDLMNHPRYARLTRTVPLQPDGTFRFVDLPAGTYGVRSRVPGYDVGGTVVEAGASDVVLLAEIPAPLDFEVRLPMGVEPGRVTIRVRDADDPAARVRVETIEPGAPELRASMGLVRRGRYHITAFTGEYWVRLRNFEVPDGFRPPVVLEMEKTQSVDVAAMLADGTPRPGSRVRVAPVGEAGAIAETFWSGEGGVARVTGLYPGEYAARIVEDGRPIAEVRFTVPPDGPPDPVDLVFPPYGSLIAYVEPDQRAGGSAVIEVRRADGTPCFVNGPGAIEKASRFRVPSAGELRFTGVESGRVELILTVDGREVARRQTEVITGEEVSVRMR